MIRSSFGRLFAQQRASLKSAVAPRVRHGSSHGHGPHELKVPVVYDRVGKGLLICCYLWVMYRLKEDKGQLFGLYQPWLHEHEHEHEEEFEINIDNLDKAPTVARRDGGKAGH